MKRVLRLAMHRDGPVKQLKREQDYEANVAERNLDAYRLLSKHAWAERSFLGVMSPRDIKKHMSDIAGSFDAITYFMCFYSGRHGEVEVIYTCRGYNSPRTRVSTTVTGLKGFLDQLAQETGLSLQPLDRGDSLLFAQETRGAARRAICAWCLCAKRMGVVKDVAQYIARLLWQDKCLWMP